MKKSIIISAVAASLALGATALQAEPGDFGVNGEDVLNQPSEKRVKHTDSVGDISNKLQYQNAKACVKKEIHIQHQKLNSSPDEVMIGLNDTFDAIRALQKNEIESAKKSLASATKAFNMALKENPELGLVPVANEIKINELENTPEQIEAAIKQAKKLLDNYQTQDARAILVPLKDDIVIVTQYLPMDMYPVAAKNAQDELDKGHKIASLQVLMAGLGTMIVDEVVMPIPLLSAEDHIAKAFDLDKTKKKEAGELLKDADAELKKVVLLGYIDRHAAEYKALSRQIEVIQKEIKGKNEVEKLYDQIKNSFKLLIHKIRSESYKNSVAQREAKVLQNPSGVKGQAAAKAEVEVTESKDMFEAKEKTHAF